MAEDCTENEYNVAEITRLQAWEQNLEPEQTEKIKTVTATEVFTVEEVEEQATYKDSSDHEQEEAGGTDVKECLSAKQPTHLTSPGFSSHSESSAPTKGISPRGKQNTGGTSGGLSNETSVWDSFHSVTAAPPVNIPKEPQYPKDYESLQDMRKNIAMELLWVQQAINSRKNAKYLHDFVALCDWTSPIPQFQHSRRHPPYY
uniref:IQ domain-containing protein C n=1 Tax=Magallana gigas TaxID=29159 RepID=K1R2Z3_MAGGI